MDEHRKRFLDMECTPGKDGGKVAEMTAKDLEHDINLVEEGVAGFERTYSSFERTVGTIFSNSVA